MLICCILFALCAAWLYPDAVISYFFFFFSDLSQPSEISILTLLVTVVRPDVIIGTSLGSVSFSKPEQNIFNCSCEAESEMNRKVYKINS